MNSKHDCILYTVDTRGDSTRKQGPKPEVMKPKPRLLSGLKAEVDIKYRPYSLKDWFRKAMFCKSEAKNTGTKKPTVCDCFLNKKKWTKNEEENPTLPSFYNCMNNPVIPPLFTPNGFLHDVSGRCLFSKLPLLFLASCFTVWTRLDL